MSVSRRRQVVVRSWDHDDVPGIKRSFSTRRVPQDAMKTLIEGAVRPRPGDLVLATVARLGQHQKLETDQGRRAHMHVGDTILVAYGDRYAPDQFEAHVPTSLGPTQLVASGGIASTMISRSRSVRNATDITPIGLIGDERGRPLNLRQFALRPEPLPVEHPRTITVVGTSMNSGKTTTIHYLAHALAKLGLKPGVAKVTGTGSGGDYWVMLDAGAHRMLDFTDAGLASTYRQPMPVIEQATVQLLSELVHAGCGVNLIEIADGIFQQETSRLIDSPVFRAINHGVIFAAGDAMGAYAGVQLLRELGHDVLAVSGRLTLSPLAIREAEEATGLEVLGIPELSDPATALRLLGIDAPMAPTPAIEPSVQGDESHDDHPITEAMAGWVAQAIAGRNSDASSPVTCAGFASAPAGKSETVVAPSPEGTLLRTIDLTALETAEQ